MRTSVASIGGLSTFFTEISKWMGRPVTDSAKVAMARCPSCSGLNAPGNTSACSMGCASSNWSRPSRRSCVSPSSNRRIAAKRSASFVPAVAKGRSPIRRAAHSESSIEEASSRFQPRERSIATSCRARLLTPTSAHRATRALCLPRRPRKSTCRRRPRANSPACAAKARRRYRSLERCRSR